MRYGRSNVCIHGQALHSGVDVDEGLKRWQADVIFGRMVAGHRAAMPDVSLQVGKEAFRMMDAAEDVGAWCGFGVVMIEQPLDLFGIVDLW